MSKKFNIGKFLYFDWLLPIADYIKVVDLRDKGFDLIIPLCVSIIITFFSAINGIVSASINGLNTILPNILAILIGFSISAIAVITTSQISKYDKKLNNKFIGKHEVTTYRYLLIIMIFTLMQEITTLILVFAVCFLRALWTNVIFDNIVLCLYIFLILSILSILIRSIIYLYASNFNNGPNH